MRTLMMLAGLVLAVALPAPAAAREVNIKGTDDGVRTTKQQDYREAVLHAKLQAIEQSGEPVAPFLAITNFQLRAEAVEARARQALQPGFQVVDIGYVESGSYEIVLVGKLRAADIPSPDGESGDGRVQAAIEMHRQGRSKHALRSLEQTLRTAEGRTRREALLAKGLVLAGNERTAPKSIRVLDELRKLAPESPEARNLETILKYKYVRYKLHNDEPKLDESDVITGIRAKHPHSFTYVDETGKRDVLSFPFGKACVNDECGEFRRRMMQDRRETTIGRYFISKTCKDWTNVTESSINTQRVDIDCVMVIERTDLGL